MLKIKFWRIENVILMKILEQGNEIERGNFRFNASNGIEVFSYNNPSLSCDTICLRGNSKELDEKIQQINIVYATEKQKMLSVEEQILRLENTLSKLRNENEKIENQKADIKNQKQNIQNSVEDLEKEINELSIVIKEFAEANSENQKYIDLYDLLKN